MSHLAQPKGDTLQKFMVPTLCAVGSKFVMLDAQGEIALAPVARAAHFVQSASALLVCHVPYTAQKLNIAPFPAFDLLELYAFVYPAKFCVPTPAGIAKNVGADVPQDILDYPLVMIESANILLETLAQFTDDKKAKLADMARVMGLNGRGWQWTSAVMHALGVAYKVDETMPPSRSAFSVWGKLPEWADAPPLPPPSHHAVTGDEVREKLASFLTTKSQAESRAEQVNYATRLSEGFATITDDGAPMAVLAEAGTGVGKTLGYLAPAIAWTEKNEGHVLISTYTKNLQRQIGEELKRIYPDDDVRAQKVTVRKGRENYLCLLNFEDMAAAASLAKTPQTAIAAGLMARWVMETEDGDLTGNSFHGWLPGILGIAGTVGLADRRGECIFSGCDHYRRCFSENVIRRAARTPLVIANHAVVMIKAAHADDDLPSHLIFDEGHHIFDAADSSFGAALTGMEGFDLRRWLIGPEGGRKSRARGLKKRIEDLIAGDNDAIRLMEEIVHKAHFLPLHDWLPRLRQGQANNSAEIFLTNLYHQVWARAEGKDGPYSLETPVHPISDPVQASAAKLQEDLKALRAPITRLAARLRQKLSEQTDTLAPDTRARIESVAQSLERRVHNILTPWVDILISLEETTINESVVDWMEIDRNENTVFDVGLHRHYIDPTKPMADALIPRLHSMIVTSATLKDKNGEDWTSADIFSGARHLDENPVRFSIPSPYDYAAQTRVFVVTDVKKTDMEQLAAAYRELFIAAGGGGLGLFTSIQRLRGVHKRIHKPLSDANMTLYAQHVDGIDTGTLVDMFRDDTHSCLLGTDAIRDGVDVPGESLRLIAFDRVPWPRATLLHKARRKVFGGADYDDRLTRLKLKQAFGRLIRTATDRGVFIMLDSAIPTRLLDAFPSGVVIERIGIAEAISRSRDFLQ